VQRAARQYIENNKDLQTRRVTIYNVTTYTCCHPRVLAFELATQRRKMRLTTRSLRVRSVFPLRAAHCPTNYLSIAKTVSSNIERRSFLLACDYNLKEVRADDRACDNKYREYRIAKIRDIGHGDGPAGKVLDVHALPG